MELKFKHQEFISNLRKLRRKKGYTIKQLANLIQISECRMSQLVNGSYLPNYIELKKLSNVFNISIADLVGNKKKENLLKKKVLGLVEGFLNEKHNEDFKNNLMDLILEKEVF